MALAVEQGGRRDDGVIDAIGPETFTYRELVKTIGRIIGRPRPTLPVPAAVVYTGGKLIGTFTGDVMITREELRGLMADLLHTHSPPAAPTKLTTWAAERADQIGQRYASELARRIGRTASYEELATGKAA